MPDRKMEFTIAARDEASTIFQKIGGSLEDLRKKLDMPFGPMSKGQQNTFDAAVNKQVVEGLAQNRLRARDAAAARASINRQVDDFLGEGGRGFSPSERRSRSMQAAALGLSRADRVGGGYGYDITRLRGGLDALGSKQKADEDLFKSLNEQKEKLERIFKLGGAVGIAAAVGDALQKIPDVADQFRENIKHGMTQTEAFATAMADAIPGIGGLAKGFRTLYDSLDAAERAQADEYRKRDERRAYSDEVDAKRMARDEKRIPIIQQGKDAAIDALDRLGVAGTQGDSRALAEAAEARNKANRQLDQLAQKKALLSPEQALVLDKQIATARAANDAEYEDKRRQIFKDADAKFTADRRAHADQIKNLNTDAYTTDLERQGKYLTAKLTAIGEEASREREQAKRAYEDALKDPDQDPKVAAERRDEAIAAINRRSQAQQRAAREQAAREAAEQRREFDRQIFDADQDMGARRLRMLGQADDAEKAQAQKAYADRLAEIEANYDQQAQANAERIPEFREQARRLAEQAGQEYGLTLEEIRQQQEQRFRPDFADTFSGASAIRRGALSRTAGAGGGTNYAEKIAKANEEIRKGQDKANGFLEAIANALKSGGVQIVVAQSS